MDSWEQACNQKPRFMLVASRLYPNDPICWIDADAVVHKSPDVLFKIAQGGGFDLAAHLFKGNQLISGTVLIPAGRTELLKDWEIENEKLPGEWDQRNLRTVVKRMGARVKELPPEYCWIFDLSKRYYKKHDAPVIEHFQHSRTVKKR
jgi:hypothetical protein